MQADLRTLGAQASVPSAVALYLAVVQFFFVTTWTVYVIFLPTLLETVGISRSVTVWILLVDQLIFTIADTACGVMADRMERLVGRLGPAIAKTTLVSCVAFLALPQVITVGPDAGVLGPVLLLSLTLVWTVTSSFLRAPPWVMLFKYAAVPSVPWLAALSLLGFGAGSAVSSYLGVALRNTDPRLPFALSSLTLIATTWGLVWAERSVARARSNAPSEAPVRASVTRDRSFGAALSPAAMVFLIGAVVLALGFQVHIQFNSEAFYLRYARPEQLDLFFPLFWVGFSFFSLPATSLAARFGAVPVMAGFAILGTIATLLTALAPGLELTIVGQLLAGGSWGCIVMAGFTAALGLGRSGREGLTLGLWFSVQAMAAVMRIGAVAVQANAAPGFSQLTAWLPPVLWLVGAALLFLIGARLPRGVGRAAA